MSAPTTSHSAKTPTTLALTSYESAAMTTMTFWMRSVSTASLFCQPNQHNLPPLQDATEPQ